MSKPEPTRPLLDSIDDPRGITSAMPADVLDGGGATEFFVQRVQEIRWELHALWLDLDSEGVTDAASMVLPMTIDLLGVAVRAEAAYSDDPNGEAHAPHLFYPGGRKAGGE